MNRLTRILPLLLLILNLNSAFSQSRYPISIGANIFKGFIYMHTPKIGHLITEHPSGLEFTVRKSTTGRKYWESAYNYPDVGVSFIYFNYRNNTIGESFAVVPYWDFYLNGHDHALTAKFKLGGGLVYNTRPYDKETNNKNNVLSSQLAYSIRGALSLNYDVSKNLSLFTAISLTHFSNGAARMPNKGINIPAVNLGVDYKFHDPADYPTKNWDKQNPEKGLKVNVLLSSGYTETTPEGTGKHVFLNVSTYLDKRLNYKSAINTGFELFMNTAIKQDIELDPGIDAENKPDYKRVGWVVGHELFLGKMSIVTQLGTYLYNPYPNDGTFYQRLGVKYYLIKEDLFLGLSLKTHFAVAEMAEWSIGYRF